MAWVAKNLAVLHEKYSFLPNVLILRKNFRFSRKISRTFSLIEKQQNVPKNGSTKCMYPVENFITVFLFLLILYKLLW